MNVSFKRILAMVKVRNREFYRDLGSLGWVILFPLVMVVTFGYVFEVDKVDVFKVGYWSEKPTTEVSNIQWIKYKSQEEALEKLKFQRIDIALDLDKSPNKIWTAKDSPNSLLAKKLIHVHLLEGQGEPFEEEVISGKVLSYIEWVFPGIINLNIMFMGLWGVGWVIVRQRKQGVLKRLKASPLTAFEYLFAQLVSRIVVMLLSTTLVFTVANIMFPFDITGSIIDALILFIFGCFALSSIGLIFAARLQSEELCNGLLNFITYPLMFISEIWFSLEGSSPFVQSIAKFSPLWHMTDGIRKILYEDVRIWELKGSLLILFLTALVFTSIGSWLFTWTKE